MKVWLRWASHHMREGKSVQVVGFGCASLLYIRRAASNAMQGFMKNTRSRCWSQRAFSALIVK